eukprot:SAG31_NODE_517_length_14689_cov_5.110487_9_plen_621_part_00
MAAMAAMLAAGARQAAPRPPHPRGYPPRGYRRASPAARWQRSCRLGPADGAGACSRGPVMKPKASLRMILGSRTAALLATSLLWAEPAAANFSPTSRTLAPRAILHGRNKGVTRHGSQSVFPLTLTGLGAYVVLDFGKEVGGFTTIQWGAVQGGASVGLAYSESSNFAACPALTGCDHSSAPCACQFGPHNQSGAGDHSNGGHGPDLTLSSGPIQPDTNFTPSVAHMRGGFRYLNLFLESAGSVKIMDVSVYFTAAPTMANPAAYANHFTSSDELLNEIWYGCAYTTQMCSISPSHGRNWPAPATGWNNGVLIGAGKTLLVDGAKRDRTIWPGDMGVSVGTALVTTGDVNSSINSLETLLQLQSPDGMLPYVGPAVFCQKPYGEECATRGAYNSDMYHMWAVVGASNIFLHTSDLVWLRSIWPKYLKAVGAAQAKVKGNGLMAVNKAADWARGGQGGANIAANSLLAHILDRSAVLATAMSNSIAAAEFTHQATELRKAINIFLWDEAAGAFKDNPTSKLLPQDGNALALWFKIASTPARAASISKYLKGNWGEFGAASPEWNNDIGTFPGSMEVLAHAASGDAAAAMDLIRLQWGCVSQSAARRVQLYRLDWLDFSTLF